MVGPMLPRQQQVRSQNEKRGKNIGKCVDIANYYPNGYMR